jgi:hypothetical protein
MALTQTALIALGGFATLCTVGIFQRFDDDVTPALIAFVGMVAWSFVAVGGGNVLLPGHRPEATTVAMPMVQYFAAGLAVVTFLVTIRLMLAAVSKEATDSDYTPFEG